MLPCSSGGKESAFNAGDPDLTPGSARYPGEGNGNSLSILAWEIPWTDRLVYGVEKELHTT